MVISSDCVRIYRGSLKNAPGGKGDLQEVEYQPGQLAKVLDELLQSGAIGGRVTLGLDPALDVISTARADDPEQLQAQAQLAERLGERLPGGVASCVNPVAQSPVKVKSLVLFPRRIGVEVLKAMSQLDRGRFSLVSTSHALVSRCNKNKAAPRKWKNEVRLVVGRQEMAALLVHQGTVLARLASPLHKENPGPEARSLIQRLATLAEHEFNLGPLGGVILHANEDFTAALGGCTEGTSVALLRAAEIPFDPAYLAAVLANGKFGKGGPLALDSVVNPKSDRPAFPLREALPLAAGIAGLGVWLWMQGNTLLAQVSDMETDVDEICAEREISREDLVDARDGMMIEISLAEAFLMDRVYWSEILTEVPSLVPDALSLTQVEGRYPFSYTPHYGDMGDAEDEEEEGPEPGLRWVNLTGQVKVPELLRTPVEARQLTAALKASLVISKLFPMINEPSTNTTGDGAAREMTIKVYCRPPGG